MWNHTEDCIKHIKTFSYPVHVWINRYGTVCYGESYPNYRAHKVGIYARKGFDEEGFLEDIELSTPNRRTYVRT